MLLWVDLETTGLVTAENEILEVAIVVTDDKLEWVAEVETAVTPARSLDSLDSFITNMHEESGLLAELRDPDSYPVHHTELDSVLCEFALGIQTEAMWGQTPLAGNNVGFDRNFLRQQCPTFEAMMHYRNVDVSTVKELMNRWSPGRAKKRPKFFGGHRAAADIRMSIDELKYYRDTFLNTEVF